MPSLSVEPDGVEVQARPGESILAALHRSGYGYRVGCRRGGCGICKVDVVSGEVRHDAAIAENVLPSEERGQACLSCRAVPSGDVVIALRNDRLRRTSTLLAALNGAMTARKGTR